MGSREIFRHLFRNCRCCSIPPLQLLYALLLYFTLQQRPAPAGRHSFHCPGHSCRWSPNGWIVYTQGYPNGISAPACTTLSMSTTRAAMVCRPLRLLFQPSMLLCNIVWSVFLGWDYGETWWYRLHSLLRFNFRCPSNPPMFSAAIGGHKRSTIRRLFGIPTSCLPDECGAIEDVCCHLPLLQCCATIQENHLLKAAGATRASPATAAVYPVHQVVIAQPVNVVIVPQK